MDRFNIVIYSLLALQDMSITWHDCDKYGKPSKYMVNLKGWCIGLEITMVMIFLKQIVHNIVNKLYYLNRINYRTHRHLKHAYSFITFTFMFVW